MAKPNHGSADVLMLRTAHCVHCLKPVPELVKGSSAGGHVRAYGHSGLVTASWCSKRCATLAKRHGCNNLACFGSWRVKPHGVIADASDQG